MCSTVTVYFEQLFTSTYGIHTRQVDRELMSGSMKEVMGKVLVCADSTYYILMKTFFSSLHFKLCNVQYLQYAFTSNYLLS